MIIFGTQILKMKRKIFFIIAIIFIVAGLTTLTIYFTKSNSDGEYGEELIANAAQPLKSNLAVFLSDVESAITDFNKEVHSAEKRELTPQKIDTLANGVLTKNRNLKGVVLFANNLRYVFLTENKTRITTFSLGEDSLLNWKRLDKNLKEISEWTDTYNFFLNKENRTLLEKTPLQNGKVRWLKLKSELPDRKDIILQVHHLKTKDDKSVYVAYVFQTNELSGIFLSKLALKNPVVSFLTQNGNVFTPIATTDTNVIKKIKRQESEIKKIFNTWESAQNLSGRSYSFEIDNQIYWSRVDIINKLGIKAFSLTVSRENLNAFYQEIKMIYVYTGAGLIIIGLIILIVIQIKKRNSRVNDGELPEKYSEEKIIDIISRGESENVEFKSSLRYDYRQGKENRALEDVILKSIAAFANAKGGTLFIGVKDNGEILGLENDFNTLKKSDVDYFELHLRKLIKNQFGINFSNHKLRIYFEDIEGKTIAVIQITTAQKPIYLKVKNKQGQVVEKFYVRSGNSSQEITSLKEMEEYITHRFKRKK